MQCIQAKENNASPQRGLVQGAWCHGWQPENINNNSAKNDKFYHYRLDYGYKGFEHNQVCFYKPWTLPDPPPSWRWTENQKPQKYYSWHSLCPLWGGTRLCHTSMTSGRISFIISWIPLHILSCRSAEVCCGTAASPRIGGKAIVSCCL